MAGQAQNPRQELLSQLKSATTCSDSRGDEFVERVSDHFVDERLIRELEQILCDIAGSNSEKRE